MCGWYNTVQSRLRVGRLQLNGANLRTGASVQGSSMQRSLLRELFVKTSQKIQPIWNVYSSPKIRKKSLSAKKLDAETSLERALCEMHSKSSLLWTVSNFPENSANLECIHVEHVHVEPSQNQKKSLWNLILNYLLNF